MHNYSEGGINERCFFGTVFDDGRAFLGVYTTPYSPVGDTYFYGLAALNDGCLDATFGSAGLVKNPMLQTGNNYALGGFHVANDEAIGTDDQVLMIGYHFNGTNTDVDLTRIISNGGMGPTLGTAGVVRFVEGGDEKASAVFQGQK